MTRWQNTLKPPFNVHLGSGEFGAINCDNEITDLESLKLNIKWKFHCKYCSISDVLSIPPPELYQQGIHRHLCFLRMQTEVNCNGLIPIQGVLPIVYRIKELKKRPRPPKKKRGFRAIDDEVNAYSTGDKWRKAPYSMAQDGSEWSTLHSGEFTDCHITDFFFV
jgi:hypothetical protein